MAELITDLRERFDVVLIDAPPLLPVTDSALLAAQVGRLLLVTRHGKTTRDQLEHALERVETVDGKTVGVVINMAPSKRSGRTATATGTATGTGTAPSPTHRSSRPGPHASRPGPPLTRPAHGAGRRASGPPPPERLGPRPRLRARSAGAARGRRARRPVVGSVGAARAQHRARRTGQDREVLEHRPVVDVVQVQPDGLLPGQVRATGDLPQTGDARAGRADDGRRRPRRPPPPTAAAGAAPPGSCHRAGR